MCGSFHTMHFKNCCLNFGTDMDKKVVKLQPFQFPASYFGPVLTGKGGVFNICGATGLFDKTIEISHNFKTILYFAPKELQLYDRNNNVIANINRKPFSKNCKILNKSRHEIGLITKVPKMLGRDYMCQMNDGMAFYVSRTKNWTFVYFKNSKGRLLARHHSKFVMFGPSISKIDISSNLDPVLMILLFCCIEEIAEQQKNEEVATLSSVS